MNATELLPAIRDFYSKHPEFWGLEAWELRHVLYSLGYTNELEDEGEIAATVEVAREDWPQWRRAV